MSVFGLTREQFLVRDVVRSEPFEPGAVVPLGYVAGHISNITSDSTRSGGVSDRELLVGTLMCGPDIRLTTTCEVVDPKGVAWQVRSVQILTGLGLAHQKAEVTTVVGRAA